MPTVAELRDMAEALLGASGVPAPAAKRTAELIVLADVWGIPSHGLLRLPHYLARLHGGGCRADAELTPMSDSGVVASFDGGAGLGHWQLWTAAQQARDRCLDTGIAAVAVHNSSHCGALGSYVYPGLAEGLVTLVVSNGPPAMPPWSGHTPVLSTSPIAAGFPAAPAPIVIDLATSAVARGTVAAHAQRGEALEPGWAFDANGKPTTDPRAAMSGMLAPLGGAKGYVLALLVECLTGALVGPTLSGQVADMFDRADDAKPQGIGHLVLALRPESFGPGATERFSSLVESVRSAGGRTPGLDRTAPDAVDPGQPVELAPSTADRLAEWQHTLGLG
ncbi:(2R)-3-sulfolactate dehydrogenase (NADP+) [Tamaricihabitans halophyticus]|uniref:(2R)-3-sulfolactate dehydrogenase (NADP+) n=1 Tax=Tamaricihabitans halophyticus TaxID=1262583 RepID=A0A4R2QCU2_9PSEU|nr:Ldh family oxidoreductase [Tamaricihabitans halophyticus]TCP44725.1 (2R)-3-sulfolactate dehydrogenase (NADP+) [Tamaricihabitans halophyticus]